MECSITVTAQAAFNDEVKIYVDMQAQIFSVFKARTVPITLKQTVEEELEKLGKEGNIKTVYRILSKSSSLLIFVTLSLSKCILIADENRVVIQLSCTHRTSDESEGIMRIAVGYTVTVQASKFYTLALTF